MNNPILRFINKHVFSLLLTSVAFTWAGFASYDRYTWWNNSTTLRHGYCNCQIAEKAGIYCRKDDGIEFRITTDGHAFYRTPPMALWPFYRQEQNDKLLTVRQ
jgi:hypothetical protein